MSLYNALFGRNPASRLLLSMLNLTEADVGRFRDCYLTRGTREERSPDFGTPLPPEELAKKELRILVYTRNGGGNRESYEAVTEGLQAHPAYITDYDDSFDCTYANYEFKVPEVFKATAEELANLGGEPGVSPERRFINLIEAMKTDNDNADVKRAREVGKEIVAQIEASFAVQGPASKT